MVALNCAGVGTGADDGGYGYDNGNSNGAAYVYACTYIYTYFRCSTARAELRSIQQVCLKGTHNHALRDQSQQLFFALTLTF